MKFMKISSTTSLLKELTLKSFSQEYVDYNYLVEATSNKTIANVSSMTTEVQFDGTMSGEATKLEVDGVVSSMVVMVEVVESAAKDF